MNRLEAFEKMLADLREQTEKEQEEMDRLRAGGKEKSATYRQLFANRVLYRMMLDRYRAYGLLNDEEAV